MSDERRTDGPGLAPNEEPFEGELFIRDLGLSADEEEADAEEEEDGLVTTMMVGEEGERGLDRAGDDEGVVTTLALGEEGDRTLTQ